ncbi:alternative oxidase [Phlyctema vagabunda]|uniref:Alternative oxidase n=1 Tax=Phlyctema vagabunda TaxID=108571 RepID=A0ABR4P785_9HELO
MLFQAPPGRRYFNGARRQRYVYAVTGFIASYILFCQYRYRSRVGFFSGSWNGSEKAGNASLPAYEPFEIEGPHDIRPLQRLCNETIFTSGLIFMCDENSGGIGNIRNYILTCIRYGIAAGASGLTIPQIQTRGVPGVEDSAGPALFSHFFDEDYFRQSMDKACPQIRLYGDMNEIEDYNEIQEVKNANFKSLDGIVQSDNIVDNRGPNRHLVTFRRDFEIWLKDRKRKQPSPHKPVTVRLQSMTFFEWDVSRHGQEFANTFGRILKFRPDVVKLAKVIITKLAVYTGAVDEDGKPRKGPDGLPATPFLGVHLRTEPGSLGFWPSYQEQSDGYLKINSALQHKFAYVASGSIEEIKRFSDNALDVQDLNVTSKHALLLDADLWKLQRLRWDQQALVDYLVLLKSAHFVGCSFSTFAFNIALRRHLLLDGIHTRPFQMPTDGLSTFVGKFEAYFGDWMWIQGAGWP